MSYDLVIRGGKVVDGSGAAGYIADVGVSDGKIVAIGRIGERGKQEIDAEGHIVSPGFIDGHTHMDAQVHWDALGSCSCYHGVTSVVMGNCGFTLAPSRANARELVVRNLERAEDISPAAMAKGIKWEWETFPEYLDVLDALPKGINYAANIGHSSLRTWAMGERAFGEDATEDDLVLMENQLQEAMRAGAIGFTTSRTNNHETSDNRPVASRFASWEEVSRLVTAMGKTGGGIFELAPEPTWVALDTATRDEFCGRLQKLSLKAGVAITLATIPGPVAREAWEGQLAFLKSANAAGAKMRGQCHPRGVTILLSFLSQLPFDSLPEWKALRAKPLDEQKRLLRDPTLRQKLVHEAHHGSYGHAIGPEARKPDWNQFYLFDQPFPPYPTVTNMAAQRGIDPVELMIDLALETDFRQLFLQYLGPVPNPDDLLTVMSDPNTITTFSDTGAHVSQISDSSLQTYLIAQWARERKAFTVEQAVRMVTSVPAEFWGMNDRGLLKVGMAADINVFDFASIKPGMPTLVNDLPGGARRFFSKTEGIRATVVAGQIVMDNGTHTGALPGRLLRRTQAG